MIRFTNARGAMLLTAMLLTAGCAGGGEGGNTANSNAANANANTTSANTATANTNLTTTTNTSATASGATASTKLNLNTATGEQFKAAVPNLGDRMVHEFEEYRPYRSIQQFRREMAKYVKPEQIAEYEKYVFVPVSPNESDEATLQQIPGIDAEKAKQLTAGRPYASNDAFLQRLGGMISPEQLATARAYMNAK